MLKHVREEMYKHPKFSPTFNEMTMSASAIKDQQSRLLCMHTLKFVINMGIMKNRKSILNNILRHLIHSESLQHLFYNYM